MSLSKKFAICISADKNVLLTPRRIYQILPDEKAERSDFIRVIDDEGEDYLYPKKHFVFVPLSSEIEEVLMQTI